MDFHLAELNLARAAYDLDDPRMADFVNNLDRVNGIAERSPGFVWRLKDDGGNATAFRVDEDPLVIPNLSVWESAEDLERFVWGTIHRRFYERRAEWFPRLGRPHFVMWHIPAGTLPTLEEAVARLRRLTEEGPSEHAFGWEALPNLKRWMQLRCA